MLLLAGAVMGVARVGEREGWTCMYLTACMHSTASVCTAFMLSPVAKSLDFGIPSDQPTFTLLSNL